jgi:two-component system response regulator PilR (NtrC family)
MTGQLKECQLQGDSSRMQEVRDMVMKLARSQAPIYVSGESGTGKELAARLIHARSPRADQPFVAVNCGAIPRELMESEMFGHKKGAFTGAVQNKDGLFMAANHGTLFLDEVADLPLSMQVKLLRVIQDKKIRPVGSEKEVDIEVRIISATHKDLDELVANGGFRQDLYYRLNVIEMKMPALRERPEDIPTHIDHILQHLSKNYQQQIPNIDDKALAALSAHTFPGNVRELENILERAFALCEEHKITVDDLGLTTSNNGITTLLEGFKPGENLESYLSDIERASITKALEAARWNKTAAAKLLGISFRALRYRLQKLDIDDSD